MAQQPAVEKRKDPEVPPPYCYPSFPLYSKLSDAVKEEGKLTHGENYITKAMEEMERVHCKDYPRTLDGFDEMCLLEMISGGSDNDLLDAAINRTVLEAVGDDKELLKLMHEELTTRIETIRKEMSKPCKLRDHFAKVVARATERPRKVGRKK